MKKVLAQLVVVAAVGSVIAIPGPAHAEECITVPIGSPGVTIEAGGQSHRIPALASASVCYQLSGLPGIPWVRMEYGGASVVITGGSSDSGHVAFRYVADGVTNEVKITIPPLGSGGGERCLVGVGSPSARPDCEVKIHVDDVDPTPLPTLPPTPSPEPLPTLPPTPTVSPEPLPTLPPTPSPEPLPTLPPIPEEICTRPTGCVPPTFPPILDDPGYFVAWLCAQIDPRLQCHVG